MNNRIVVALPNEVITYVFENGIFSIEYDFMFDLRVVGASCLDSPFDNTFVLLEDGGLFGYGSNYKNILLENDEDVVIDSPILVETDVIALSQNSYVTQSGCCFSFAVGELSDSLPEGFTTLMSYYSWPLVCTTNTAYSISKDLATYRVEATFDEDSLSSCRYGLLYEKEGDWYYSGPLSAPPRGKDSPEADSSIVDLPDEYKYQVVYEGIVGYDEHTIICYSV